MPPLSTADAHRLIADAQADFPLVPDPWAAFADRLHLDAAAVLAEFRQRQADGILREVSGVLEGEALGHESCLAAGKVPVDRLEAVAEIVNGHPTVTHNYLREHDYNLWFTLAVPHRMGLDATLEVLGQMAGGIQFFPLRRTHTFKIGVRFRLDTLENDTPHRPLSAPHSIQLSPRDEQLFRTLQTPLPLVERPFAALAEAAGADETELLEFAARHKGNALRKYVATLRHRKAGVKGNGMAVWNVADDNIEAVGELLAGTPHVSHCYARNPIEGFPYTVYSMLHAENDVMVRKLAADLAPLTGCNDYLVLCSTREFKKCRLRYFLPELDRWWSQNQCRPVTY